MPEAVIEGVNKLGEEGEQVEGIELLDMFRRTTINDMQDLGPKVHRMLDNNYDDNYGDDNNEASDPDYQFNKKKHNMQMKFDEEEYQDGKQDDADIEEELENEGDKESAAPEDTTTSEESSYEMTLESESKKASEGNDDDGDEKEENGEGDESVSSMNDNEGYNETTSAVEQEKTLKKPRRKVETEAGSKMVDTLQEKNSFFGWFSNH